ncbi:MAG: DUF2461 domain-containing protein [Saccharospirillaceae bacterium]|nr:DUF2461 domain-containing protein [Pseudomonadales bacterium]NRB78993.1 DUF2461 domain-containing protein [Saccharospirillaceae bacterium]
MSGFYPDTFEFLEQITKNNNKVWFDENREKYEYQVRTPALEFIEAFAFNLSRLSPHFLALPKKMGGSLMRIHRDMRFSKDKTPYKTNVGISFRHEAGKDIHAPGFYLHLDTNECFIGVGIWRPDSKALNKIRDHIDSNQKQWLTLTGPIASDDSDTQSWYFVGDTLVRPPKGFDKEHPLINDLKRKDFIVLKKLTQQQVCSPSFADDVYKILKEQTKIMAFLCKALDVPF